MDVMLTFIFTREYTKKCPNKDDEQEEKSSCGKAAEELKVGIFKCIYHITKPLFDP